MKNNSLITFKNIIFSKGGQDTLKIIISNVLAFISGMFTFFILPNTLGPTQYGFWQLFIFYYAYIGFLGFGYPDGILIQFGSKNYDELEKKEFRSYTRFIIIFESVIAVLVASFVLVFIKDDNLNFIFIALSISIVTANVNVYFSYIAQVTRRFTLYSYAIIAEKLIFISLLLLLLLIGLNDFKIIISVQVLAWISVLFIYVYKMNDIVIGDIYNFTSIKSKNKLLFSIGIPLMIANILAMGIPGVGRFIVEQTAGIESFSYYSFAFTPLSIAMIIFSASSTVLYPTLSRLNKANLTQYKDVLNSVIVLFGSVILLAYYPIVWFITNYVSQYTISIRYIGYILPLIIYNLKIYMVITNYYKILKRQQLMLKVNLIAMIFTISISVITYITFRDLEYLAAATLLSHIFWAYFSESILNKELNTKLNRDYLDLFIVLFFLCSINLFRGFSSILFYSLSVLVIVYINRSRFKNSFSVIISNVTNK